MVRIFAAVKIIVPSLIFLLIAAFLAARMLVGLAPDSELYWRLYFLFAPFGREVGIYVDASPSWHSFSIIAGLVFLGLAASISSLRIISVRTRFVMTHASLLVTLFALNDERVFSATTSSTFGNSTANWWPDFTAAHPVLIALLLSLIGICLVIHWHVVRRFTLR